MVMLDPPDHTVFRRMVARGFTPRQVSELEPQIRAFVRARLGQVAEQGETDIVRDLLKPLPSMIVAHYLGVPEEDRPRFDGWTEAIVAATGAGDPAASAGAAGEMFDYFTQLIERRRSRAGRGHDLAAREGRRRRERPADARLRLHHGRRWQRHDDRPARCQPCSC